LLKKEAEENFCYSIIPPRLPVFLFVTVLAQALFTLVGVHFFALSFFSAWHKIRFTM